MTSVRVPNFLPSTSGFAYDNNAWPHNPIRQFKLGNVASLNIGDAANGLCGGMSFTLADLHRAGLPGGPDARPAYESPRYTYIVQRQIDSFQDGVVPLRFYTLMSPVRAERETWLEQLLGRFGVDRHSRTWTMIQVEWPTIRKQLDSGQLAAIGLVRTVSADPNQLSHNHQVLAWGYDLDGTKVSLRIWDPNFPRDDEVVLGFDAANPSGMVTPTWSKWDSTPVCFFAAPYASRDPAPFRA
jgi:hypothetical protein